jgi:hypothetical protein
VYLAVHAQLEKPLPRPGVTDGDGGQAVHDHADRQAREASADLSYTLSETDHGPAHEHRQRDQNQLEEQKELTGLILNQLSTAPQDEVRLRKRTAQRSQVAAIHSAHVRMTTACGSGEIRQDADVRRLELSSQQLNRPGQDRIVAAVDP